MEIQTTEIKATDKKIKKKPKMCPLKHSNFFVTINSNKHMPTLTKEEYENTLNKFKTVIDEFFNVELKNFVVLTGSKIGLEYDLPRDAPREELEKRIVSAKAEYVIEIGPESGKLHAHGLLALSKRGTDSKLDYVKIKEWLEKKLEYPVHFNSQLYRDAKQNLQTYLSKAPAI